MKSRWWNIFDAMVEIVFKPTAGGYVYRAPSLWPFCSGGHYMVNEEQKSVLAGLHLRMYRALFWMIVVGAAIGGPLASAFGPESFWTGVGMAGLVGLAIGLGASMWLVRKVKPIIATLAPTRERITQCESFRAQAKAYSMGTLIGLFILDVVMLLLAASVFLTSSADQYAAGWIGVVVFGACTIYTTALFVSKRKQSAA